MSQEKVLSIPSFDHIRPYEDREIGPALKRLARSQEVRTVFSFLFGADQAESMVDRLRSSTSVDAFQVGIMHPVVWRIVELTTDDLSWEGFDALSPDESYLFMGNHRDILLDSALLQILLHEEGLPTSQISFGSNLMQQQLLVDIGRINKMYTVKRDGSQREQYQAWKELSEYIRHTISEKGESMWIAQRNGRTKDGLDRTQPALLRMLCLADPKAPWRMLEALRISPVAVSYEYEPCDYLKVRELYLRSRAPYQKAPGEDLQSILTGIREPKGRVHLEVGRLPDDLFQTLSPVASAGDIYAALGVEIDHMIRRQYRLWPTHFAAWDLLNGAERFADRYTQAELNRFQAHIDRRVGILDIPSAESRKRLLELYANPVQQWFYAGSDPGKSTNYKS